MTEWERVQNQLANLGLDGRQRGRIIKDALLAAVGPVDREASEFGYPRIMTLANDLADKTKKLGIIGALELLAAIGVCLSERGLPWEKEA